jgi:hypothetical protein
MNINVQMNRVQQKVHIMEFPNLRAAGHVRTSTHDPRHISHTSCLSLSPSLYTVSPLDSQPRFPRHIARHHASYKGACISLPLSHFLFLHSATVTVVPSIVHPASESLPMLLALLTVPPLQLHPCRLVFLATHLVSDCDPAHVLALPELRSFIGSEL